MTEGCFTERAEEDRGCRDADLNGAEETVGVADQLGDPATATAALAQRPHLALAQRDESYFGRHEQRLDDNQRDDDENAAPNRHQRVLVVECNEKGLMRGSIR